MSLTITFVLFLTFGKTGAFLPNRLTSNIGQATFTHQDITEIGILKAVAAFFEDNPRNDSNLAQGQLTEMENISAMKLFQAYYGRETTGKRLQDVINGIVTANNLVNKDHANESSWHCNGETIREANFKMTELRGQIIGVLLEENANFDLARELIGQFLHIMQMFYSNTNWVEMFGSDAYYTLGIRDKPLLAQAPSIMSTCRSCGILIDTSCKNTLIVDGAILTSGYRSGQDAEKPFRNPGDFKHGKCSHGGPSDTTGTTVAALGGINKDSVIPNLSPHYYLHQAAAQAAINHTTFFFNDKVYGLRHVIGEDKYEQFLQIKPGTSLVFNIDSTGSMGDDIDFVKNQVIDITLTRLGTPREPSNYIVVLFNDPAHLTTIFQSEDSTITIDYIRNISVYGGGDCAEFAMDGIKKALQVCHPNSDIQTYTDAPAKDAYQKVTVETLADAKNVRLLFFVTDGCRRRRREATHRQGANLFDSRHKRSNDREDLYRALAAATGGSVYVTSKGGLNQLASIVKETATSSVTILKRNLASTESSRIDINVDNTVRQLTIEITGSGTLREKILNPSGDIQNTTENMTDVGVGKLIKLHTPARGIWRLSRLDSNPWTVKVTAQSTLEMSSTFVQMDPNTGFEYELIGRPVAGENATIVIFVPSKDLISTLDTIQLIDPDGIELARHDKLTLIEGRGDSLLYKAQFPLPTENFQVAVSGEDTDRNRYTRLQNKRIAPVAIQLHLLPGNETLYVDEKLALNFVVVNKGGATSNITVTINDDQNFAQSPLEHQYTLRPNQNAEGQFILQSGPTSGVITTVTVSANAVSSATDSSQFVIKRISTQERDSRIMDNTLPLCNITSITGNCDVSILDSCTCSQYKWSGTAVIGDEGFGLYQITSSVKDAESFSHDPFTAGHTINNGVIKATLKSDCCNPLTYITIVDMASNTGQCVFNLAPGLETPFPECKPTEPAEPNELSGTTLLIIAAAAGGAALIIIIIVVIIICVVVKSKTAKKKNYTADN